MLTDAERGQLAGAAKLGIRLAAVAALTAVATLPFLPSMPPRSIDGPLHLYRLAELDHCISMGDLFPRWAPDLAQGYGFPLFNFYPPLGYYLAEVWHLLGFSLVRSLNLTFLTGAVLSGVFMYLLVRDWASESGAVLAALLYVYAPYSLYNAVHRGGLAEVLAWALAPLVLWAFGRLMLEGRPRWLIVASLSYAALLLAHHLSALTFTPLLALYVLGHWVESRSWRRLGFSILALTLAVGTSAFFTLPAFFERGLVQIWRVSAPPAFDFHSHFVSWQSLLAGPMRVDLSSANRVGAGPIGWLQIGLGLMGVLSTLFLRAGKRSWYLGALAVSVMLVAMMLRVSSPVWEAVPLLGYLQFPWRLLAPLGLVLAFMGGGVGELLARWRPGAWAEAALMAAVAMGLFLYHAPLLYNNPYRAPSPNPTVADVLEFERSYWLLGLSSNQDYLPIWVEKVPQQSAMAAQYEASAPVTWLDPQSLPAGARVQRAIYSLNDMRLTIDSPVSFQVLINQFYFPGWRAYVDGTPAATMPVAPHGLIGVHLPAGLHELRVHFEDTRLRQVANLVSLLSLFALVAATWAARRAAAPWAKVAPAGAVLGMRAWALLFAAMASFITLKVAWLDGHDTWFKVTTLKGDRVVGMETVVGANLGNDMLLLGYDLPSREVAAGEPLDVHLYWRALRRIGAEYSTSIQLVDRQGRLWGQHDNWHPGGTLTVRWEPDTYVLDAQSLTIPAGTPPGEYELRVGAYSVGTLKPLDVLDANGAPAGTWAVLGKVRVVRPARPPERESLGMREALSVKLNEDLELLGCDLPQDPVRPGQRVSLTLFWRALRRPQADYQALLLLKDGGGRLLREEAWPVASIAYPTSVWETGEVIRARYDLLIPAEAPVGGNTLQVTLSGLEGGVVEAVTLGELDVVAVSRRMDVPEMQARVGATFGDSVTLLGYDVDRREVGRGEAIHLTLYWQARRSMEQEYTVFTHLLDGTDHISAQQDSVPVRGTRPTTSWVEGEVIVDEYELVVKGDAPTGEHQIEVGLYEPESGRRLSVTGEMGEALGDRALLAEVQVR